MRTVVTGLELIRNELDTCLLSTFSSILRHAGRDDEALLGTTWDFHFPRTGVRREEYYLPLPRGSLIERLAPFAGLTSEWLTASDDASGWTLLKQELVAGRPTAIAVDNFYLPFRPAYHDVHSNHLILAYGFDEDQGTVFVLDATPPRFMGEVSLIDLQQARGSSNLKSGSRDHFFTNSTIAYVLLRLSAPPCPAPQWSPAALLTASVTRAIGELRHADYGTAWLSGIAGLAELAELVEHNALDYTEDLFIFTGTLLAQRARYARFLERSGGFTATPALLAHLAGRASSITHQWATVRILCSREAQERADGLGTRLARVLRTLAAAEDQLLRDLEAAIAP